MHQIKMTHNGEKKTSEKIAKKARKYIHYRLKTTFKVVKSQKKMIKIRDFKGSGAQKKA